MSAVTADAAHAPGGAFGVLLRKELLESIRVPPPWWPACSCSSATSSPVLARYLPEIIELAGGEQLGVIRSRRRRPPTRSTSSSRTLPSSAR